MLYCFRKGISIDENLQIRTFEYKESNIENTENKSNSNKIKDTKVTDGKNILRSLLNGCATILDKKLLKTENLFW